MFIFPFANRLKFLRTWTLQLYASESHLSIIRTIYVTWIYYPGKYK